MNNKTYIGNGKRQPDTPIEVLSGCPFLQMTERAVYPYAASARLRAIG